MANRPAWMVLLICLLLGAQVLPYFTYRWVEDESWYSATAYSLCHEGRVRNVTFPDTDIESKADTRPLGMPVTLAAAFESFGVGPWQARLPAFLASIGTVIAVFFLGSTLVDPSIGLLAALLVSVDNFFFLAARTVRPEAFVALFGSLAVLLYFISRKRDSLLAAVLCGVALGLSFNYHTNGYPIALSIGLLLIAEFRWAIWRSRRAWAIVLASAAMLLPFYIWVREDPVRLAAFRLLYGRGAAQPFSEMIRGEGYRYLDLLGVSNQRLQFASIPIPLRFHIVTLILASLAVLAWKRRGLFWTMLALIVPSLLIWPKEVNPTARYFAILAPYFALTIALAWSAMESRRVRIVFGAWCALVVVSQIAGNLLVLRQSRTADYVAVTKGLRSLIPGDARIYGGVTFFLALHDHPFLAWHRTPMQYAAAKGVDYLILNDRVMLRGVGHGNDDYQEVREQSNEFARNRAQLVGRVSDPFYGDMEIYRVRN